MVASHTQSLFFLHSTFDPRGSVDDLPKCLQATQKALRAAEPLKTAVFVSRETEMKSVALGETLYDLNKFFKNHAKSRFTGDLTEKPSRKDH